MTSISGTLQLSAGDLSNMAALPQQLEALVGTAHQNLTSISSGDASGNAISKLLANLNGLGGQAANLPDLGPLLEPIHSLVNELPAGDLVNLQSLSNGVDQMLGVLGPAKDLIVGGKLDGTLQEGAQRAVEAI